MRKHHIYYFIQHHNSSPHTPIFTEICDLDMSSTFPSNICCIPTKLSLGVRFILTGIDFYLQFYSKYDNRKRLSYLLQPAMENRRFNFLGIIIITMKLVNDINFQNGKMPLWNSQILMIDNMLKIMKLLS